MDFGLIFTIIEHIGVIAFAISGALVAIDKEMDLLGVIILAFITSFGGGIMRDLILGLPIPLFFTESFTSLIVVCLISSVLVLVFAMCFKRAFVKNEKMIDSINNYIDAVGLGAFTVSGAKLAISVGYTAPFVPILMGVIACVGGGMIRDMMLNDVPFVLRKRIYALAAAAGSALYYTLWYFEANETVAMISGALVTILIRVLATIFKWNMPKAINFSKLRNDVDDNK